MKAGLNPSNYSSGALSAVRGVPRASRPPEMGGPLVGCARPVHLSMDSFRGSSMKIGTLLPIAVF